MTERRMSSGERRELLLDIARSLLAAEGFSGITLDRVAYAGGVSRALLYKYFGGLGGLVTALVDRDTAVALDGLKEVLMSDAVALGSAEDTAEAIMFAMVDSTAHAPLCWSMLLNPPRDGPPELYERIAAGRAMARTGVEYLVKKRFRSTKDVELTSRLLHLALEEMLRLHLHDPSVYPLDRLAYQARRSMSAALISDSDQKRIRT